MSVECTWTDCDRNAVAKGECLKHYRASRRPKPLSADERFWVKITDSNGCWEWTGRTRVSGYGAVTIEGRHWLAHRYAYTVMVADIPKGLQLDHLCRNRLCVNPDHLEPVTAWVNNMRSESPAARRYRMTRCTRGHEFTEENTYLRPDRQGGGRMCRACCALRESRRTRRSA